jgi:cobalt-zinc-cadmium efflux system membrane fusion protein
MNQNSPARSKAWKWVFVGLGLCVVAGALAFATYSPARPTAAIAPEAAPSMRLLPGSTNTLELTPQLIGNLGVRTAKVASAAGHERLKLSGSLLLDSNRMVRVHSRFSGEVASIANNQANSGAARPLRLGDRVSKGQLLAVIWSKDVGEKKSDLVDALSKLYMHQAQLKNLQSLPTATVAGRQLREAERECEADIIEVDRLERTLRSWRLTDAEIAAVSAEAEKIHRGHAFSAPSGHSTSDLAIDKSWAEVEVRSPLDGVVLEKNIVAGDMVDTNLDLFEIADLSKLGVIANVYEEDLPTLESLPREKRQWTVQLKSQADAPGIPGSFELIGNIVDPNQHTAAVMGWLDNHDGRLRAGQFVTAIVELPATAGEVVVPDTAIVQDGTQCTVFVAADETGKEVTRRRVALVGRGPDVAYVRSQPREDEQSKGCEKLLPGEWVVTSGSIELDGALENELATTARPISIN